MNARNGKPTLLPREGNSFAIVGKKHRNVNVLSICWKDYVVLRLTLDDRWSPRWAH